MSTIDGLYPSNTPSTASNMVIKVRVDGILPKIGKKLVNLNRPSMKHVELHISYSILSRSIVVRQCMAKLSGI